ncbi:class I SAM-dependent methyltransferase [Haloarchaeobius sp. HME9146]|uniref:class I SAM-dependent methyltransferase n=1 Tax=Haloarchaeobius sp. HME9146 TaxID=2978732 RepID=UPI0021BE6308|nr:class I SAM-dependent methyltransferase [Haloarchaeobius sp. HME9146]MCT9095151.1 class I SAM-dependent methyltransferase [Haloarchaeobius sp. HME9146]
MSENAITDATWADPGAATRWEDFYSTGDYDRVAYIGREAMPGLLARFIDRHWPPSAERTLGGPASVASVGCGPAVDLFELAVRYPDTEFYGYDVSASVIEDNRRLADELGFHNVHFAVDALPELGTGRTFDLVYCMATLYFVDDAETAVRAMYDHVRPGGQLVFNYPNRYTHTRFDREFTGARRELFRHVVEGDNLLSYRHIEDLLGTRPRDYWALVGARHHSFVGRDTPCVAVPK